jgi:hemolysin III
VYAALSATELTLIAIGGVAYSSGALAYAFKRPNPKPGVFGYHEVFHALTIIGASAHFVMVLLLVRRTR